MIGIESRCRQVGIEVIERLDEEHLLVGHEVDECLEHGARLCAELIGVDIGRVFAVLHPQIEVVVPNRLNSFIVSRCAAQFQISAGAREHLGEDGRIVERVQEGVHVIIECKDGFRLVACLFIEVKQKRALHQFRKLTRRWIVAVFVCLKKRLCRLSVGIGDAQLLKRNGEHHR